MVETIGIILLVIVGIVLVAVLAFGGWLTFRIIGLIGRGMNALFGGPALRRRLSAGGGRYCPRPKCCTENVAAARFCRRCGVSLDAGGRQLRSF